MDRISDWQNLNEKSQHSFRTIRKAADRMNALIDTVYFYTRLDASEQLEMTPCDIASVLADVEENLSQLIEERGAIVVCETSSELYANRIQMIQVFQNLITNSIRHCDSAVAVHVSATDNADHWQLTVRDNGPGIASEYVEKIFDPFKRLSYRKEDEPGLGLGLAINRKIIESYGGKIWCESAPGNGTTFIFTLPKTMSVTQTTTIGRILLVDDNEADIELNKIMLIENYNLRCDLMTAFNGKQALAILQETKEKGSSIDLILLDINMPVMSGFELMVEMQRLNMAQDTMVVMCTTSAYDIDKKMASSFGAAGFLTKPPQFSLLKEIIDKCGRLRLSQEGDNYTLFRAA